MAKPSRYFSRGQGDGDELLRNASQAVTRGLRQSPLGDPSVSQRGCLSVANFRDDIAVLVLDHDVTNFDPVRV